jgi:polyisoprenoid-binding protein YceI
MMISKVRGRFLDFDGNVEIDEENPQNSVLEGTIEVESINTGDTNRDDHLRSGDFFEAPAYPQIHFTATGISPRKEGEYEVRGNLTIKDTTREVIWEVETEGKSVDPWGNRRWALSAEAELDRRDFGLTWNVPLEAGGVLVGNKVEVEVNVQFVYQTEEAVEEVEQEEGELVAVS